MLAKGFLMQHHPMADLVLGQLGRVDARSLLLLLSFYPPLFGKALPRAVSLAEVRLTMECPPLSVVLGSAVDLPGPRGLLEGRQSPKAKRYSM